MMNPDQSIGAVLGGNRPVISVEFFPPKDEAGGKLILETASRIREQIDPDFVSITYGAGGGTRERTFRYAEILRKEYGFAVMPHLTCVGSSRDELREILRGYRRAGFRNVMALRGDPPKGETAFRAHPDGLPYAVDLIGLIREEFPEFCLGAAGYPEVHPEAISPEEDLRHLRAKVDAGAAFITTQLFFDNRNFLAWARRCRESGISVPLVPGLMPIRSAKQARRFCEHIPEELDRSLEAAGEDREKIHEVGIEWTTRQIRELMDAGFRAFHLYIMNRSGMATEVFRRLRESGHLPPSV